MVNQQPLLCHDDSAPIDTHQGIADVVSGHFEGLGEIRGPPDPNLIRCDKVQGNHLRISDGSDEAIGNGKEQDQDRSHQ